MRVLVGIALGLLLTLAPFSEAYSNSSSHTAKIRREMDKLVAMGAPGVLVLLRNGDQVTRLARGFGEVSRRAPMRADDRFRVGSLTKTYAATVVLQLVGEGKVSLDDSLDTYLPGVVPNAGSIKIRHLLNHTSGLFDYWRDQRFFERLVASPTGSWTPQERIALATSHPPLFAPGAGFSYSNTGYIVLGLLIEKVSGRSLAQEYRDRIFVPLRLSATSAPPTHRIEGRHAHGYYVFDKPPAQDVTAVSASAAWGNGDIVSTADDIATFYRALLAGRLLKPDLLQAMVTTVNGTFEDGTRYGLGIGTGRLPCGTYWGHDGEFAGYVTTAKNSRNGSRQVVIMVNSSSLSKVAKKQVDRLTEVVYCGS
jgi:D-alanyl-D-alanine carboxypeptidase